MAVLVAIDEWDEPTSRVLAEDLTLREVKRLAETGVEIRSKEIEQKASGLGDVDPDELAGTLTHNTAEIDEVLDAMDSFDIDAAVAEQFGLKGAEEFENPNSMDKARFDQLSESATKSTLDVDQAREERDTTGNRNRGARIRQYVRDSQLVQDLTDALRELKTRDRDLPATSGDSLNLEAVVRHHAGAFHEKDLYLQKQNAETGDRAISVALDMSGSMDGRTALAACAALAEATSIVGDDFMGVSFRKKATRLITAPGEQFEYDHLDQHISGGNTPTALGLKDALGLVLQANRPEKLVIVITDGAANVTLPSSDSTGDADADVRMLVQHARDHGVRVIGLGISGAQDRYMQSLFGPDYVVANANDLVEALTTIYRRQMKVA